jgi:hypothetical protein
MSDADLIQPPNFQKKGFRFDKTITAGNVMTLLAGIIAGLMAYVDYRLTLANHEYRITSQEAQMIEVHARMNADAVARADMTRALDQLSATIKARDEYRPKGN